VEDGAAAEGLLIEAGAYHVVRNDGTKQPLELPVAASAE
jgi:hypothetical protein